MTLGVFNARDGAENAIDALHRNLKIEVGDVSYLYRNADGKVYEVRADEVHRNTAVERAMIGTLMGALFGAVAGIATVVGVIPVFGPIFAAGPLLNMFGLGAGPFGTTVVAVATGTIVGSFLGAIANVVAYEPKIKEQQDKAIAGGVLVAVYAQEHHAVEAVLAQFGATTVESYSPSV